MDLKDLIAIYELKKKEYGNLTYKYISDIFKEIKEKHKLECMSQKISDIEQSWRAFKGKNLEKIIEYIIVSEVKAMGLDIINGNKLERSVNLNINLQMIKRNLCVDYGKFGLHLPDVDMVIYEPNTYKILAVLSSKVTLSERIAQTGYWKLKLLQSKITKHIKVFFITLDEDNTLQLKKPSKKGRAIVEIDTDGCYILTKNNVEISKKVKYFDELISDLKKLLK
ncbi:MAG: BsaWI family type II restriction enzyme [Helicobacter sp.]|nr:BsaWI family type II restriction enzyme [Helicobacter sp.]